MTRVKNIGTAAQIAAGKAKGIVNEIALNKFLDTLTNEGIKTQDFIVYSIRIYKNAFSTKATFICIGNNLAYFDKAPSLKVGNKKRILKINKETLKNVEVKKSGFFDKFNINSCGDHIILTVKQDSEEKEYRIFAEIPGMATLTQDKEGTQALLEKFRKIRA